MDASTKGNCRAAPVLTSIHSPRWLLEKHSDDSDRALRTLAKIRSGSPTDDRIREEFHEMVASYEYRKRYEPGYMGLFKSAAMRKRLCYGFYASALQQFGGIAALTMYATLIYQSLGWDQGRQALAINGIQSVLQLFIVLVNTFTVDRFGRRTLLTWGFAIQASALLILSSLTTRWPNNDNSGAAVAEIAMLFIVGLTYCWSNGPISATIASEIFPQHVRDKAFGISLLGQTICLIALTQPWPRFNAQVGGRSYWLLFSRKSFKVYSLAQAYPRIVRLPETCPHLDISRHLKLLADPSLSILVNLVALVSVILILPETKQMSLERMDKVFGE